MGMECNNVVPCFEYAWTSRNGVFNSHNEGFICFVDAERGFQSYIIQRSFNGVIFVNINLSYGI